MPNQHPAPSNDGCRRSHRRMQRIHIARIVDRRDDVFGGCRHLLRSAPPGFRRGGGGGVPPEAPALEGPHRRPPDGRRRDARVGGRREPDGEKTPRRAARVRDIFFPAAKGAFLSRVRSPPARRTLTLPISPDRSARPPPPPAASRRGRGGFRGKNERSWIAPTRDSESRSSFARSTGDAPPSPPRKLRPARRRRRSPMMAAAARLPMRRALAA